MSTNPLYWAGFMLLAACSGAPTGQGAMEPTPSPRTEAVLAGPLCSGDACKCRQGEEDAGSPDSSKKRFEVRMGPSDDPLWVTVDGMVLFKSRERADACYYVDLDPGKHPVKIWGQGEGGLSVAVAISEQGGSSDATWWYSTFEIRCGAPGQCSLEEMNEWRARVRALEGKHDPCGSTKVEELTWETGRMPDRGYPDGVKLDLALNVYGFTPKDPPGCKERDDAASPAPPDMDEDSSGEDVGAAEPVDPLGGE